MEKESTLTSLFFELLKAGLWDEPINPSAFPLAAEQWQALFQLAKKQALLGVIFDGVVKLPKEHHPPTRLKLEWIAIVQKIEQKNIDLNRYAVEISERFRKEGFRNIVLKGQGLAAYYPHPLHRQSGDIDIYMEGGRKKIGNYVKKLGCKEEVASVHYNVSTARAEIECHVICSKFYDPFKNKRFQKMLNAWTEKSFDHTIPLAEGRLPIPIPEMNHIYVLQHIYRHLFGTGIGLRQFCDYALLMDRTYSELDPALFLKNLEKIGMKAFAEATFFILTTYLGYPKEKLPFPIKSEKLGRLLFSEVMATGNFGQHDERRRYNTSKKTWRRHTYRVYRILIFLRYFPMEVICTPIQAITNRIWIGVIQRVHGYRSNSN